MDLFQFAQSIAESENRSFILLVILGAGALVYLAKDLHEKRKEDQKLMSKMWEHLDKAQEINSEHADLLRELKEEIREIRGDLNNLRKVELERLWVEIKKRKGLEKRDVM